VVGDLLASLFRQTIYNRMENLLLDPGKKSDEKDKIIESAVQNYHRQVFQPASSASSSSTQDDDQESSESLDENVAVDISNFAGFWIRAPAPVEGPTVLASTQFQSATTTTMTSSAADDDVITKADNPQQPTNYVSEAYDISDLFSNERPAADAKSENGETPKSTT